MGEAPWLKRAGGWLFFPGVNFPARSDGSAEAERDLSLPLFRLCGLFELGCNKLKLDDDLDQFPRYRPQFFLHDTSPHTFEHNRLLSTHCGHCVQANTLEHMKGRTETVTIRLSPKVKADLQRLADEDRRPLSQYIAILIEEHLKARAKDK